MKRQRRGPSAVQKSIPDDVETEFAALKSLVYPHVASFDNSVVNDIHNAVKELYPAEIQLRPPVISVEESKSKEEEPSISGDTVHVKLNIEKIKIGKPKRPESDSRETNLYPSDCRERGLSYIAPIIATFSLTISHSSTDDLASTKSDKFNRLIGYIPVMVGSQLCHLHGLKPRALVKRKEDALELGGYFICNGIERVVRMLQMPKANYPHALQRPSYKKRGAEFSDKAVTIRCLTNSCRAISNTLHYIQDGTVRFRVVIRRIEFFIPVVLLLKALKGPMTSDREIYHSILGNQESDLDMSTRIEMNFSAIAELKLFSAEQCKEYLGKKFRVAMREVPENWSDVEIGQRFLDRYVLIHCGMGKGKAKFRLLIEMMRKLFRFVLNKCVADNPDSFANHDLLLPGQIYGQILRERLEMLLFNVQTYALRDIRVDVAKGKLNVENYLQYLNKNYIRRVISRQKDIGENIGYFLATGNLSSESGLDMLQIAGFTVVAEKLNHWRYLSHFRSVHRGQFFTQMRTTGVRKLLPEAWGFLCPVQTPDGSPCGLLTHLSAHTTTVCTNLDDDEHEELRSALQSFFSNYGFFQTRPLLTKNGYDQALVPILLDGVVLGYADNGTLKHRAVPTLRILKSETTNSVIRASEKIPFLNPVELLLKHDKNDFKLPASMEINYVDIEEYGKDRKTLYPGLYLYTGSGRTIRPVVNFDTSKIELIGPSGQQFMNIAMNLKEREDEHTHCEVFDSSILSLIATLTPFSDFNQSPRNMYQCQMAKQTMGTPCHNLKYRTDTKLYCLNTPQMPICQSSNQANFLMDEYANGTNATVAVISYTGYDMEDACIINKAALNRGFKHGTVYKTQIVDVTEEAHLVVGNISVRSVRQALKRMANGDSEAVKQESGTLRDKFKDVPTLDFDGLPKIGQRIEFDEPYCAVFDSISGRVKLHRHKSHETAFVESVTVVSKKTDKQLVQEEGGGYKTDTVDAYTLSKMLLNVKKVVIKLRFKRNPIVGDKFASRAAQKGVLSVAWPQEDMPFTADGITPDLIINPHAFPSRMTIGMLLESMAGKAGCLHGSFQDSTPFVHQGDGDDGKDTAVDFFGKQLLNAGYSYYGAETMYSGILGVPLQVDIYIGIVYYQRLRHMVSDKSQARSTGPIDPVTRQPVKGRKRMGGVRFGEMERDSLLAHGSAFLVQDRLMNCSDRHIAYICCESMLSVSKVIEHDFAEDNIEFECRICRRRDAWKTVAVPFVLRYLVNELAAMGIKWKFEVN